MQQRAKRAAHGAKISVREDRRQRDTRIDDHPAMPDDPTDHAVAQTTQWRPLANCSGNVPTDKTEKQATISDMLLLSKVRGCDENSHLMRVDTVREPRDTQISV